MGTKALGLNSAEVGDTVPCKRTMREAFVDPGVSDKGCIEDAVADTGVVDADTIPWS